MPSKSQNAYYLNAMGLCCSVGNDKETVSRILFSEQETAKTLRRFLTPAHEFLSDSSCYYVGRVTGGLPALPAGFERYNSRNNQMLLLAFSQIEAEVRDAIAQYGADRVAVILGTSTSGIAEGEDALSSHRQSGVFPDDYHFGVQEVSDGAEFLVSFLDLTNMAVTISTACSSSAKVFSHAAELMDAGLCDAAIVGGIDSLCHLTVNGFHSLGALSDKRCNPFSQNRTGISIGEGGALFLMTRTPAPIRLMSVGESSDGYSMTAPEPNGAGAENSMLNALSKAGLDTADISYVNLHGTATPHNDSMESKAVARVFGAAQICSSSKSIIGHTLGAAGATELALCWLMLSPAHNPQRKILPHLWDGVRGEDIALENFANVGDALPDGAPPYILSNFFAFGGSNASVILKQEREDA